ncbi:protein misato homolog 1-like [Lingula anatina]|nr:protein misato homolog 1-like [Lingula anatina]|eukprot:XP_013399730.1 protein misato homolog 1-like [Lingula anatina]
MAAGDMSPWKPVTPYSDNTTLPFAQTIVGRGVLPDKVQGTIDPNAPKLLKDCSTADEVLGLYLAEMFPNCISSVKVLQSPCQVTAPYPHMFSRNISSDGYVSQKNRSDSMGVNSVPVMTSLQSTPTSAKCVQALLKETKKLNISKYNKFLEAGLEQDDYKECLNSLETLQENYVVDMSFS